MKSNLKFLPIPIAKMLSMLIMALIMVCLSDIAFAGEWERLADMREARLVCNSAVIDETIYTFGGLNLGGVITSIEKYNPQKNFWEVINLKMNPPISCSAIEVINKKIYIFGGAHDGFTSSSIVQEYDPINNQFEFKKNMPKKLFAHSSVVLNSKIYIIGGFVFPGGNIGIQSDEVFEYNPELDTYNKKKSLPIPRDAASACAINGKIYLFGGLVNFFFPSNATYEYDPTSDNWTKKTNMPNARAGSSVSIFNGKIYVIGGLTNNNSTLSVIDVYDPIKDMWVDQIQMTSARCWHNSVIINNELFVIGGTHLFSGWNWPPQDILPLVEKYSLGDPKFSVNPNEKLPTTWASVKAVK